MVLKRKNEKGMRKDRKRGERSHFVKRGKKYGEKRTARTHAAHAAQTMAATPSSEINYGVRLPRVPESKILKIELFACVDLNPNK